ncbi:MAG: lipopolysaccharide biosynthesis protein, partial [Beijerinckiaceae bacterium]|nr:lipopolysaccharide biosynthesis protein [Beijerinckiaceae bacterium]
LTQHHISTMFWSNVLIGGLLASAMFFAAPVIARFYGNADLVEITYASALVFFIGSLGQQHSALMQRHMRLGLLSLIEATSMVLGVLAAICAAYFGWRYWSLVVMQATAVSLTTIGFWAATKWRPGPPAWSAEVFSMLTFGSQLTVARLLGWASRSVDQILLGRFWGEQALGYYSRSQAILIVPLSQVIWPLTRVGVPALSRLQHDPESHKRYFKRSLGLVVTVTMPGVVFLTLEAPVLIPLLLGDRWTEVVPIFIALAPAAFVYTFSPVSYWIFASLGRMDQHLRVSMVQAPLIVAGVAAGASFGAVGVAAGFSLGSVLAQAFGVFFATRRSHIRLKDVAEALFPACLASAVAGGAVLFLRSQLNALPDTSNHLSVLLFEGAVFIVAFVAAYLATSGGRENVSRVWRLAYGSRNVS